MKSLISNLINGLLLIMFVVIFSGIIPMLIQSAHADRVIGSDFTLDSDDDQYFKLNSKMKIVNAGADIKLASNLVRLKPSGTDGSTNVFTIKDPLIKANKSPVTVWIDSATTNSLRITNGFNFICGDDIILRPGDVMELIAAKTNLWIVKNVRDNKQPAP